MKKLIFLILPIFLFSSELTNSFKLPTIEISTLELEQCYDEGRGDSKCGKDLAMIYKESGKTEEKAAEIFLDLSLKGDVEATRELALIYIYGKKIPRDCKKGVYILLNAADGKMDRKESAIAFREIAKLFKNGTCVEKDKSKYKKYNDIYMSKVKKGLK